MMYSIAAIKATSSLGFMYISELRKRSALESLKLTEKRARHRSSEYKSSLKSLFLSLQRILSLVTKSNNAHALRDKFPYRKIRQVVIDRNT